MKKTIYILSLSILTVFGFTACEDPIDLDLGAPVQQFVIDAIIDQTTDTQFIHITKSIAYLNNQNYQGYQVDTVGILDTSDNSFHAFNYKGNGWYYFVPTANTFKYENTYTLVVKEGANTYLSQSTLRSPTTIDSFTYEYDERGRFGGTKGNYVSLWAKDKPGIGDYYWLRLFRNDSIQLKASEINIAADNSFTSNEDADGDLFIVPIRENFTSRPYKTGETAKIEILTIPAELHIYLNLIVTQLNNQGLFAVPPSNIPSNIFCVNNPDKKVLGFFAMVGKVSTPKLLIQ